MSEKTVQIELTEPQIEILKSLASVENFGLYCLSEGRARPAALKGMSQRLLGLGVRKLTELEFCRTDDLHNVSINAVGLAWLDANDLRDN
ncbi:MAG: hypothetical protein ACI9BW_003022 [Gammaproteobacteria bacterium]|jgi:hypothetical protein